MKIKEVVTHKTGYQLYKITGDYTPFAYYGYGDADKDPLREFLKHARRTGQESDMFGHQERGGFKLIQSNNGDHSTLRGEQVESYETELEAFNARNDMRAREKWHSISGPSMFPHGVAKRAAAEHPDKVAAWEKAAGERKAWDQIISARTARKAYELGAWKYEALKDLKQHHEAADISKDLDALGPFEFAQKYDIKLEPPGK